jgi:hypothetical protein
MVPRDLEESDEEGLDNSLPGSSTAQKQNLSELLRSDPPWAEQAKVSSPPRIHVKPGNANGSEPNSLPVLGPPLSVNTTEARSASPAIVEDVFQSKTTSPGTRNRPGVEAREMPVSPPTSSGGHGNVSDVDLKQAPRRRSSAAELADFFKNTSPDGTSVATSSDKVPFVPSRKSDTADLADFLKNTPPPNNGRLVSSPEPSPSRPKPSRIRSMIAKVIHKGQSSERADFSTVPQAETRARHSPEIPVLAIEEKAEENHTRTSVSPKDSRQDSVAEALQEPATVKAETADTASTSLSGTVSETAVTSATTRPSTLPQHQVLVFDISKDSGSDVKDPALIALLRNILSPYYTVGSISGRILRKEPWEKTCALLIVLSAESTGSIDTDPLLRERISAYMRTGGPVWSIGPVTALFCHAGMSIERKMVDDDLLFPGAMTFPVARSPEKSTIRSSRATLAPDGNASQKGEMLVLEHTPNDRISALGWTTTVCKYAACASDSLAIASASDNKAAAQIKSTLAFFGIQPLAAVNTSQSHWKGVDPTLLKPTQPLPVFIFSHPKLASDLPLHIVGSPEIDANSTQAPLVLQDKQVTVRILRDTEDTFNLIDIASMGVDVPGYMAAQRSIETIEEEVNKRRAVPLLLGSHETWRPNWTPLFDFGRYWSELDVTARKQGVGRKRMPAADPESLGSWSLGDVIQYGEAVGSTQTMLDR